MSKLLVSMTVEPIDNGYLLTINTEWNDGDTTKVYCPDYEDAISKMRWVLEKDREAMAPDPEPVPA